MRWLDGITDSMDVSLRQGLYQLIFLTLLQFAGSWFPSQGLNLCPQQ